MAAYRAIRATNFALRLLQLCVSVIVLGIFSYFLAVLADHDLQTQKWIKAVAGISGAATFYTLLASIFTLKLGSHPFFAGLAMVLDFAFMVAFIAIAIMARNGTESCTGYVHTPLGEGEANDSASGFGPGGFGTGDGKQLTYMPSLRSACKLQKGAFAVSIIGLLLFLVSIIAQHLYMHHRGAKTSTTGRSRFSSFFRFPRRRRPLGPRATVVEFNQANNGTTGTIPLSPQRSAEKPPRYASVFGWGTKDNSSGNGQVTPPGRAARQDDASGSSGHRSPTSNGYGHGQGYSNWNPYSQAYNTYGDHNNPDHNENPFQDTWQSTGTPGYSYGASGVGDTRYAFGYGETQPGPAPYTARESV